MKALCVAVLRGIDRYLSDTTKGRVTDIHLVNKDEKVCKLLIEVFHEGVMTPGFRSGNLELGARNSGRNVDENPIMGRSMWYVKEDGQKGVESSTSVDRYEKQRSREKFGNTVSESMSNKGPYAEGSLSDGRYGGHGRRKHNENGSREVNEDDSRGHLQGPAVKVQYSELSEPSTPPRQELKRTGNLNIIED